MFLIDPILTHFSLTWSEQQPVTRPLPPHIRRTHVQTPGGPIELLICDPKPNNSSTRPTNPPIFFLHGGYGHASIWLEWLTYLHNHNYPSPMYAFSARAHGASYSVPFKTQVYTTTFEDILSDATYCLKHITQLHKQSPTLSTRAPILVGHSSGGGLAQALLTGTYKLTSPADTSITLSTRASGLCLVDSIPHFGSLDIYWNWLRHDPYFPLRSLFHLNHPTSPLSTLDLVHSAFFGRNCPRSTIEEFWRWAPEYESTGWPKAMFGSNFGEWWGGKPGVWLDVNGIIDGIDGVENDIEGEKICVMVGREDMMYKPEMWERMCRDFREAIGRLKGKTKMSRDDAEEDEPIEKVTVERADGVRLVLVDESGHHVQNDVYCDQAAEALLLWAMQV